jgi:hypothetical protein
MLTQQGQGLRRLGAKRQNAVLNTPPPLKTGNNLEANKPWEYIKWVLELIMKRVKKNENFKPSAYKNQFRVAGREA